MAEIVLAVIAKLAEYLVGPVVRQGQYLFCVGKITKALETEKERLASTQDGIQKRVQEALNRTEKINNGVEKWLGEVKNLMDEVEELEQQIKIDNNCFQGRYVQGRCPNWKGYRLCKQMAKKIETMKQLIKRTEFNPFSVPTALPDIDYFSSGNFVYFHSTKLASDGLLAALKDDGSYMIGLYGMGGSGKTTLVKELGKKAKELTLFDRVVFATVSQTPHVRKIQGEIADLLGLRLDEETEPGRARRLAMRLGSGERILVILDDVWAKINLKDIGIPFEDYHMGCKVLLTTRRQQVCNMMDCERKIPLDLLSEEESWTLFQKHAGIADNSLNSVAQELARKCKGLPIAIKAVGTSLKGKSIGEWKEAIRRLRGSKPIDVEPGVEDAYACLQLSYDYLNNKEAKSIFLMCCMYPEDEDILVEDLFRIAIGLGLCEEVDSLEKARYKVDTCINNLIDSCLLMHSEKMKDHLRMHDMVRDVALWIASKENYTTMVNPKKDMHVLVEDGSIKDCYAFNSCWGNEIVRIPEPLDAPKLEILLLKTEGSFELSEAAFGSMGALKVVAIVSRGSSFIRSMNFLANLRTLRLQGCKLGDDISWLVGLRRLEILDLNYSSFEELPNELEKLHKLKLLDLSRCEIKEQSYKVIKRCTQLEELYVSTVQLSRKTLKLNRCFSNNASFPKLQRYVLKIGKFSLKWPFHLDDLSSKVLYLGEFNISALGSFIKDLLQRAKVVCLYRMDGDCKSIVPDVVQAVGGMNELTSLWVYFCSNLECLIDATSHHVDLFQAKNLFPKLIKLRLHYLPNLKEVWHGPPLLCIFEKLQELDITSCSMLTSLFPKSATRAMPLLQRLTIIYCSELKNIIEEDGTGMGKEIIPILDNSYLVFSQLKFLTIRSCDKLECVFSNSCVQGLMQLEEVCITRASQLKYVFGQHEDEHHEIKIELPFLKALKLERLKNLLSISPINYHSSCPSLRELHWVECPKFIASCVNIKGNQLHSKALTPLVCLKLEKLVVENSSVEDILFPLEGVHFTNTDQQNTVISTLNSLQLYDLFELKFVWTGSVQTLSLQNLGEFRVKRCKSLESIFCPTILRSLKQLKILVIADCDELKEIISDTEVEEQYQNPLNAHPPQLFFPNLKDLKVSGCNKLKCLLSIAIAWDDLPELQCLWVDGAAQLEQVFGGEPKPEQQNNSRKNILPNLRELKLIEVPNLKDFYHGFNLSNECLPQNLGAVGTNGSNRNAKAPESLPEFLGSKLEVLWLENLPELWLRWIGPSQISNLLYLQSLKLNQCNKLKSVFSEVIHGTSLPMLKSLTLSNCEELEEIITEDKEFQTCFPELEELKVKRCNKLKRFFSAAMITLLPHLNSLYISDCARLEELFGHKSEASSGNEKEINCEELEEIITEDKEFQTCFPELGEIKVERCNKLKCFFSAAMITLLPHLNSLYISDCARLEELFGHKSEASSGNEKEIVLPNLRSITLHKLPSLVDVCKGFKLYAMNLERIDMSECPKFSSIVRVTGQIYIRQDREGQEPLVKNGSQLLDEVPYFFNVSRFTVTNCEVISLFNRQGFGIAGDQQEPMALNLDKLELQKLPEPSFICTGLTSSQILNFQYLRSLAVYQCRKLKCIFSTFVHRSLPELYYLEISRCEELEEIIAEFEEAQHLSNTNMHMSFPKLKTLEVRGCNKLKCLFWTATVGMLPKLRYIKVSEVAQLEELFKHRSKEGTVDTEEIVFPNLKFIKLEKLPSLTEVCKGLKLNAVNLSDVKINECPKLDSVLGEIQERNNQRNASSTESRDDWEDEEIAK